MGAGVTRYQAPARLTQARAELPGDSWRAELSPTGEFVVEISAGSRKQVLRLFHDREPAPRGDVTFVASALNDIDALLRLVNGRETVESSSLREIGERYEAATTGPWVCHLESAGGLGGSNVITMEGSEADLYLELDGGTAPDIYWSFVAVAHSEIPKMLASLRGEQDNR